MTVKGGSRPACAACRFQRRRCSPDCPLAPFFPANQPKLFQSVHSLYGVGHILKILSKLPDDVQKEEAMKSIQYESNIRQLHRVHGCYGVIIHLQQKVAESVQELRHVRGVLDAYKRSMNSGQSSHNVVGDEQVVEGSSDWASSMINGGRDLGFYYNQTSDQDVGYVWDDDRGKTAVDMTANQSQLFDEFQQFCNVNGQQSFLGTKEAYDYK